MSRQPVLTKADFYRRWQAGEFGNRLGSWSTLDEAEADGFAGPTFEIRSVIPRWPYFEAYIPWADRRARLAAKVAESGTAPELLRVGEDGFGNAHIIQGHVWWPRSDQFVLEYTFGQGTLRAEHDRGLTPIFNLAARQILHDYLEPVDHDELFILLEDYPDHVVEFTAYERPLGICPGHHMIIWEVRQY